MRRIIWRALCLAFCLLWIGMLPVEAAPRIIYRQMGGEGSRRVALTFDDGPHPRYTPQILDILAEYDVKATFFVIGENVEYYPEPVLRAYREGHEIGNHTYDHHQAGKMSAEVFERDMERCSETVEELIGETPHFFRPPEGVCTAVSRQICEQKGYTIVMWSVDTRDWAHTPPITILENVRKNTGDGSIILMHDFIGKNSPTPEALRLIIPMLKEAGFQFVTLSQLLGD